MDNTLYVYGHHCNHNLIKPSHHYDYKSILNDTVRSVQAKWAITPFNNNDVLEYKVVCREFGRPLEMVLHHWSGIQNAGVLWDLVGSMDWNEIAPQERTNNQYKYMGWYRAYFKDIYSLQDYHSLMGV